MQIYLQKKMIFSGMVEMKNIAISGNNVHSLVISGRSGLKKLVDGNPIYPGTSINNIQSLAACRVGHFAADNAEADPAYAA
ncbi:hypothetical protein B0W47_17615 (plasmid) [Komagataeibacter nataicola]|uniref:Uncharacterized protein n=1 Tax=Komagataeibacter nataicola TaxID=265960 RepID=A0A9N7H2Y6_9PROT|nr:hypothetical protein B0W47_17615 [Komagataeibacter nataicola]